MSDLSEPDEILSALMEKYQNAHIVLTLGEQEHSTAIGVREYSNRLAKAVDTTAAGDGSPASSWQLI